MPRLVKFPRATLFLACCAGAFAVAGAIKFTPLSAPARLFATDEHEADDDEIGIRRAEVDEEIDGRPADDISWNPKMEGEKSFLATRLGKKEETLRDKGAN